MQQELLAEELWQPDALQFIVMPNRSLPATSNAPLVFVQPLVLTDMLSTAATTELVLPYRSKSKTTSALLL